MVIGMTKGYVDFMYKGKIVRGWGDMCDKYFCIIASTIEWIFPGKRHRLNDLERDEFIEEVKRCEYELRKKYRMAFEDDNGKMIKKKIKKGKRKSFYTNLKILLYFHKQNHSFQVSVNIC